MIEINGHLIDECKISYISPVRKSRPAWQIHGLYYDWWHSFEFDIVVDTKHVLLEFKEEEAATEARQNVAIIRSNLNDLSE